jgi:5-methylcytosine-specific restriction protein B
MDKMENEFTEWTRFYEKLADAILAYKNDRKRLLSIVDKIYTNSGMENKLKKDNKILEDVCPFTVFGVFNKGLKDSNRIKLLEQFAVEFGISEKVPTSFMGIPVLNNMKSWFFTLDEDQGEDDLDNLWNLFNAAIKYADGDNNFMANFITYYNKVLKQKNVKWNITMGLYWIRPYKYLTFDECTRNYCKNNDIFPQIITKTIGYLKNPMEGEMYLNTIEQLENEFVQNQDNTISSFPALSYAAWMEGSDDKYFPTLKEYNSGISKEDWKELICNPKVFTGTAKHVMRLFLQEEGEATCGELSKKYGEDSRYYNSKCTSLAASVQKKTECPIYDKEDCKYWPILFIGRYVKENGKQRFSWKLRPELKEALEESGFMDNIDQFNIAMDLIREENPIEKSEQIKKYSYEDFLEDVYMSLDEYNTLKSLLERKKNIILQGAPGVGKTFAAKRFAYSIMESMDDSRVNMVQFHQSYSYEDFIMGYRPNDEGFKLEYGIFYNFCKKAENNPDKPFFFIIDEINRGNLSKIFGELLMLIENDKRGEKMTLAYNGVSFSVPDNIFIIGIMNTADRSLAMIDYALRRRFSFYKINPAFESEGFMKYKLSLDNIKFDKLISSVKELNNAILKDASLGEGFVIGHSYFCNQKECSYEWLNEIIEYDLVPILEEYWFDDNSKAKLWANKLRGALND